jgi:sarcosine oxidase delta subunit
MKSKKAQNTMCAWGCGRWTASWRKTVCDECERREKEREQDAASEKKNLPQLSDR